MQYLDYTEGLDFDDVLIEPIPSSVNSRTEVDLSVDLGEFTLDFPIIASPMKGITSLDLVANLGGIGGIGILHRFYDDISEWIEHLTYLGYNLKTPYGVAIGLDDKKYAKALDYGARIICIDVANGYTKNILDFCEEVSSHISDYNYPALLMAGNVASTTGARNLVNSGVNLIRTGIGSGQLCTTRNMTGVGVPQLTAISRVLNATYKYETSLLPVYDFGKTVTVSGMPFSNQTSTKIPDTYVVADGGIRNSGDAVKALVAGADVIMLGSLFGKTFESSHNGIIYGMASRRMQEEYYHSVKSVEGLEKEMEKTQSLDSFINEFTWNMKSACTYVNAKNLTELRQNANFISTGKGSIK